MEKTSKTACLNKENLSKLKRNTHLKGEENVHVGHVIYTCDEHFNKAIRKTSNLEILLMCLILRQKVGLFVSLILPQWLMYP